MSTNIYSHIALINSPEELEEVLPGLREFIENYEPNPNDAPPANSNWGGWQEYHNKIDWKAVCAQKDYTKWSWKISAACKGLKRTPETCAKLSTIRKNKTHSCRFCKKSFNSGNYTQHIRRACPTIAPS